MASPERVGYTNDNGQFILIDHSKLIMEYKRRLSFANAKCRAVQYDYASLQESYAATARYIRILSLTNKNDNMENLNGQIPAQLLEEVNRIAHETTAEKKELHARLLKMEQECGRLARENHSLKEKVELFKVPGDEREAALERMREENLSLKDRIAGLEYLEEAIEEKRKQINFLQEQLEMRVKAGYQGEQQRQLAVSELQQLREAHEDAHARLQQIGEELTHAKEFEIIVREHEAALEETRQLLSAGKGEISYLQSLLEEERRNHAFTSAALEDGNDREARLQEQLAAAVEHAEHIEQRLQATRQMVKRIQAAVNEGAETS